MTPTTPSAEFDAIVVGGGHNGLVAAFYLARGGLRPLVLERRDIVGGACVTEEFAPGFRASTGAYVLSMLREAIWTDMRLVERGIVVDPAGPSLYLFPDGRRLLIGDDTEATAREIAAFSEADARAFPAFEAELAALGQMIMPMIDWTPPDPGSRRPRDLAGLLRFGATGARHRTSVVDALQLFATSARQYLDERFESEHVKAALGWHAINDSVLGPSSPGTAYVLLHDHASEDPGGGVRQWGFVRGGIGRVTEAMADAAREAGAVVRTGADVEEILVRDGRAIGVRLAGGEELHAPIVVSNADPKHTFLDLVPDGELPASFTGALRGYRCIGTSVKINLAVDALPQVAGMDPPPADGVAASYLGGIMEVGGSLAELDRAQAEALAGRPGRDPHIELCIPTVHDPSLAADGHHVVTIDINSQPYELAPEVGGWDAIKEEVADRAIATLEGTFPGLTASIVHRQVLSPLDLERILGLTGGHALHGDMSFDQLFVLRPVRGWADYRTPVDGLYLCGAGTHPGGGVTGANGHNAAREILRDARGGAGAGVVRRVRERVGR
jgi:phytoene dehydrogenase-like protein